MCENSRSAVYEIRIAPMILISKIPVVVALGKSLGIGLHEMGRVVAKAKCNSNKLIDRIKRKRTLKSF